VARLTSASLQARAWAAIDAGDLDAARERAGEAAAAVRWSRDAAAAQEKLEAALAALRDR
jgi:hypothetical protein